MRITIPEYSFSTPQIWLRPWATPFWWSFRSRIRIGTSGSGFVSLTTFLGSGGGIYAYTGWWLRLFQKAFPYRSRSRRNRSAFCSTRSRRGSPFIQSACLRTHLNTVWAWLPPAAECAPRVASPSAPYFCKSRWACSSRTWWRDSRGWRW